MNTDRHTPRIVMLQLASELEFPKALLPYYHTHLLCHRGILTFTFNGTRQKCKSGEFAFWFSNSKLTDLHFSKGFKATVLLVENQFLNDNIPDQNWGIDATLHSRRHPVKHLDDEIDRHRVLANFQLLYDKFQDQEHRFYEEALRLQMRLFILEMWHTFANEYERRKRTVQTGTLYERFMLLVQEHCMNEREVSFYAYKLHITAKYLNSICKQNSGVTASEWIQRNVKERIVLLLENPNLNIAQIADEMQFSSRSFFTRYTKKVLGVTPTEYRNRMR